MFKKYLQIERLNMFAAKKEGGYNSLAGQRIIKFVNNSGLDGLMQFPDIIMQVPTSSDCVVTNRGWCDADPTCSK